jgi:hypothetical protein
MAVMSVRPPGDPSSRRLDSAGRSVLERISVRERFPGAARMLNSVVPQAIASVEASQAPDAGGEAVVRRRRSSLRRGSTLPEGKPDILAPESEAPSAPVRRKTLGDGDVALAVKFENPPPEAAEEKIVVRRRRSSLNRATTLEPGPAPSTTEKDKSQRRSRTVGDDAPASLPPIQKEKEPEPAPAPAPAEEDKPTTPEDILSMLKQEKTPRDINNIAELARKWSLNVSEVKAVVAGFRAADHGTGRVSAEDMRAVFAKTDWGAKVPDDIIYAAWRAITAEDSKDAAPVAPVAPRRPSASSSTSNTPKVRRLSGKFSGKMQRQISTTSSSIMWVSILEKFLEWYRANCFGAISAANQSKNESMSYDIANENEVPPQYIDKLRKRFDEFDTDGSGYIDYEEFAVMFSKLLKVTDPSHFAPQRMKRFWQEVDVDGSGEVDFPEFCTWYLKYFSPDGYMLPSSVDGGILGQFYSSFQPSVARRNSLAATEEAAYAALQGDDFAQIQQSLK